jgi:hypothetical protein
MIPCCSSLIYLVARHSNLDEALLKKIPIYRVVPKLACVVLAGVLLLRVLQHRPMLCCYLWRVSHECAIAIEVDHRGNMPRRPNSCDPCCILLYIWKLNLLSWKENIFYFRSKFCSLLEANNDIKKYCGSSAHRNK